MGFPCLRSQILMVPSSYPTTALFPKDQGTNDQKTQGTVRYTKQRISRENRVEDPKIPPGVTVRPSVGQQEAGITGIPPKSLDPPLPSGRRDSCSHHQGGHGHRLQGNWGPGRSYSHHSVPSTSKCCRQLCPLIGQVPEGATPSTGQRGRISKQACYPANLRVHEPHPCVPASRVSMYVTGEQT